MYRVLIAALSLALTTTASAGNVTVPYTFSPGATAKSAQVNADLQTLVTAINDLETRVGKLEKLGAAGLSLADLAGTYQMTIYQSQLGTPTTTGTTGGFVQHTIMNGTLTLSSLGTFTYSTTETGYVLDLTEQCSSTSCGHLAGTLSSAGKPGSGGGTWSISGASVDIGGQLFSLAGRLLISTNVGADHTVTLQLAVKTS